MCNSVQYERDEQERAALRSANLTGLERRLEELLRLGLRVAQEECRVVAEISNLTEKSRACTPSALRRCACTLLILLALVVDASAAYLAQETVSVPALGTEAFTALPLDPARHYRVEISGTYRVEEQHFFSKSYRQGDAQFVTDDAGNFTQDSVDIRFSTSAELESADRASHTYVYRVRGDGSRLSIRTTFTARVAVDPLGALTASITPAGLLPYDAIQVDSIPSGATVRIRGRHETLQTPATIRSSAETGVYELQVSLEGYGEKSVTAQFSRWKPASVTALLEPITLPTIARSISEDLRVPRAFSLEVEPRTVLIAGAVLVVFATVVLTVVVIALFLFLARLLRRKRPREVYDDWEPIEYKPHRPRLPTYSVVPSGPRSVRRA